MRKVLHITTSARSRLARKCPGVCHTSRRTATQTATVVVDSQTLC